jgi:hypothetical protein
LPGQNWVQALDSLRRIAVRDGFYLERVQLAELGDLVERQRGVVQKPDSRSPSASRVLRSPWQNLLYASPAPRAKHQIIADDRKVAGI